jgi:nitrate/TMAO reductase-like tetraheme cytochrome c subunit
MTGKTVFIFLLTATTVFAVPGAPGQARELVTIFFTGNELGSMKPCGCSGGQLGGLDRRYAVLNAVGPQNRLIIDTGSLVSESTEQNLIKFNIIVQAFAQLGYDVVNLTEQDILIARQAGLLDGLSSLFNCITAGRPDDVKLPAKFTKRFTLNGTLIDIAVVAAETEGQISRLPNLFSSTAAGSPSTVNILILNRTDAKTVATVSEMRLFDLLIVPPQSDEPTLVSDANTSPLVISSGRIGKYVGKIQATLDDARQKPRLVFTSVPVTENIPQYQPLVELYKDYQRLVKDANIIEKQPRFILPGNLEYVGSKYCKLCHDYEYEKWMTSKQVFIPGLSKQASPDSRHADAFATLEKVGSEYDPECIVCHVVGMQYQTGYISPAKTPELKDVGCENCHGPGSEHLRSLGAIETSGPMSTCSDCHTAEHSGEYVANQKQYFEKIIHWREPVSIVRVTEPNHSSK